MKGPLQVVFFTNLDHLINRTWRIYSPPHKLLSMDGLDQYNNYIINIDDIIYEISPNDDRGLAEYRLAELCL